MHSVFELSKSEIDDVVGGRFGEAVGKLYDLYKAVYSRIYGSEIVNGLTLALLKDTTDGILWNSYSAKFLSYCLITFGVFLPGVVASVGGYCFGKILFGSKKDDL